MPKTRDEEIADLIARLRRGKDALREDQFAEALTIFEWILDDPLNEYPDDREFRLFVSLEGWASLANQYPSAMESYLTARDRRVRKFDIGSAERATFTEIETMNALLGEDQQTYEVFRRIHQNHPKLAAACFWDAFRVILGQQDYALARKYLGDPDVAVAKLAEDLNAKAAFVASDIEEHSRGSSLAAFTSRFARALSRVLVVVRHTESDILADDLREKALQLINDDGTRRRALECLHGTDQQG